MTNGFLRFLLYLLLFILPLQTRYFAFVRTINNQWWEYGSFTVYASEGILWFLVIFAAARYIYNIGILKFIRRDEDVCVSAEFEILKRDCIEAIVRAFTNFAPRVIHFTRKRPEIITAAIFVCYAIISIIWSAGRGSTAIYGLRVVEAFLLIALIATSGAKFQYSVGFFVAGVFANALLGIGQFYAQQVWGSALFGISAHNPGQAGVAVVETYLRRYIRAYGGFPHPNIFGGWLVAALMLVPFLYSILSRHCHCEERTRAGAHPAFFIFKHCHCEERRTRRGEAIPKRSHRLILQITLLAVYAVLFTALVMSFSRSAFAGFALGLAGLCFFVFTGKLSDVFGKKFNWIVLAKFLFITGILSIFLGVLLFEPLVERGSGILASAATHRLEHKSILERAAGVSDALKIFREFPIFGTGFGAYTTVLHTLYPARAVWDIQPAHSVFLMLAVELGVVGAILALAVFFFLFRRLIRARNFLGLILFAAFIPLMLFDHYLWTLYSGLMLFGAMIGIAIAYQKI